MKFSLLFSIACVSCLFANDESPCYPTHGENEGVTMTMKDGVPNYIIDASKCSSFQISFGPLSVVAITPAQYSYNEKERKLVIEPIYGDANYTTRKDIAISMPKTFQYNELRNEIELIPETLDKEAQHLKIKCANCHFNNAINTLKFSTNCNIYNFGKVFDAYLFGMRELCITEQTSSLYLTAKTYRVSIETLKKIIEQKPSNKIESLISATNECDQIQLNGNEIKDILKNELGVQISEIQLS
ncbi:MAG: hypothetical protein IJ481_03645 [Alphaproteobacteria bacterium]|nr:hypothetical protein [Alphaproteobacteria bacterium]